MNIESFKILILDFICNLIISLSFRALKTVAVLAFLFFTHCTFCQRIAVSTKYFHTFIAVLKFLAFFAKPFLTAVTRVIVIHIAIFTYQSVAIIALPSFHFPARAKRQRT
jgi:hypothetical protein